MISLSFLFETIYQFWKHESCREGGDEIGHPSKSTRQFFQNTLLYSQLFKRIINRLYVLGMKSVWLGFTDIQKEGHWIALSNRTKITYYNWKRGEPNNAG